MPAAAQADSRGQDAKPPTELLEFLGEWETSQGRWMPPDALDDDTDRDTDSARKDGKRTDEQDDRD